MLESFTLDTEGFQSTLLREERHYSRAALLVPRSEFQSTLLREERLQFPRQYFPQSNFNPRSCERSDSKNHVFLSK